MLVIGSKSKAGVINGEDIWKVDQMELLSYTRNDNHLNEQQVIYFIEEILKQKQVKTYFFVEKIQ